MYKAIKTFAGINIAMKKGDTKEYIEEEIAKDLLRAGYIEEIKEENNVVEEIKEVVEIKEVEKPKKTTTRKNKAQK